MFSKSARYFADTGLGQALCRCRKEVVLQYFLSHPYISIREMAGWLLLDAVSTYSSRLERDVSSLQVLGEFYMVEYYALSPLGDIS